MEKDIHVFDVVSVQVIDLNRNPTKVASNLDAHNDNTRRLNYNAIYSSENNNYVGHRGGGVHEGRQGTPDYSPHNHKVDQCVIG